MKIYTIAIPKIKLFGNHGCYDKEKKDGQLFEISVFIKYQSRFDEKQRESYDDLSMHLNYSNVVAEISNIFNDHRYNLLESLSNDIASHILDFFGSPHTQSCIYIKSINIEIEKFNPEGINVSSVKVGCQVSKDE